MTEQQTRLAVMRSVLQLSVLTQTPSLHGVNLHRSLCALRAKHGKWGCRLSKILLVMEDSLVSNMNIISCVTEVPVKLFPATSIALPLPFHQTISYSSTNI